MRRCYLNLMVSKKKVKEIEEVKLHSVSLGKVYNKKALPPGVEIKLITEEEKEEMRKKKKKATEEAKLKLNKRGGK